MGTIIIREVPDETMRALNERAAAAQMSREGWTRMIIAQIANGPAIVPAYVLRFAHSINGAMGRITRTADGRMSPAIFGPSLQQLEAYRKAQDLVERNGPGDRELAIASLAGAFDSVQEVAGSPSGEFRTLGRTFQAAEEQYLLREDFTAWQQQLPAGGWHEIEMPASLVKAILAGFERYDAQVSQLHQHIADLEREKAMLEQNLAESPQQVRNLQAGRRRSEHADQRDKRVTQGGESEADAAVQ